MKPVEIDEGSSYIGYHDALALICSNIQPVGVDEVTLELCMGRTIAEDLVASVSTPSCDISLKDGFAVQSENVADASLQQPVRLRVIGSVFAGAQFEGVVAPSCAVRVCAGSPIPKGADAVVSGEFCEQVSSEVHIRASAEAGRNVLRAGEDIKAGTVIARKGKRLLPGYVGFLAAAGIQSVRVYRRPKVAIVAVGDEIVAPGVHLQPGQLYASNLVTLGAWLAPFGISYDTAVIGDNEQAIRQEMLNLLPDVDVILTSGGAWGSERDLIVGTLHKLGWHKVFHRVRMGPGKGIAFGLWENKPVFCLPGGPASNEVAFLQLALPGILRMGGQSGHPLQSVSARLNEGLKSRHRAWTEFKYAMMSCDLEGDYIATPYQSGNRLQAIAQANCLVCIPEGVESIHRGELAAVQVLAPYLDYL